MLTLSIHHSIPNIKKVSIIFLLSQNNRRLYIIFHLDKIESQSLRFRKYQKYIGNKHFQISNKRLTNEKMISRLYRSSKFQVPPQRFFCIQRMISFFFSVIFPNPSTQLYNLKLYKLPKGHSSCSSSSLDAPGAVSTAISTTNLAILYTNVSLSLHQLASTKYCTHQASTQSTTICSRLDDSHWLLLFFLLFLHL